MVNRKIINSFFALAVPIVCLIALNACNSYPDSVPFNENESEYQNPLTEKISFTASNELKWIDVNADSLYSSVQKPFNLDNIPSEAFLGFNKYPLLKPIRVEKINPENIKERVFNLEKIPAKKLKFRTSILGQPAKIKTGIPRLKDGASESLLIFGLDQGLTGTVIGDISQDKDGVMWIASDVGLDRFDGEYIENYTKQQGLTGDFRNRVFADSKSQIWCTHFRSFNPLEIIDQNTKTIKHLGISDGLSGVLINGIIEDKKGRIWIATSDGLNVLDEKQGTIQIINKENGLTDNNIQCLLEDQEGNIWLGMVENGIDILDEKSGKISHLNSSTGLLNGKIRALSQNQMGDVWVGTEAGIEIIQLNEGIIRHFDASNGLNATNQISRIAFDKLNQAWISTLGSGVEVYDPVNQTFKHFSSKNGLTNDLVNLVYSDSYGQIWIGTSAGEINIYNPLAGDIKHFSSAQGLNNKSSWIFALAEDAKERKWIGSMGEGIDIIDEKKGTIQHISQNDGLNSPFIGNIFFDSKGRNWVLTSAGINMIDDFTGTIRSWNFRSSVGIMEDYKGSIWFSGEGIKVYDVAKNSFKYAGRDQGLNGNWAHFILEDASHQIWVGTEFGLSLIDSSRKMIKAIDNKILRNAECYNIIQDSRGLIWFGTYGNGLIMLNMKAGTITQFSIKEGLSAMIVRSVIEKDGKIYAGTNNGISVLSPKTNNANTDNKEKNYINWNIKTFGKPQGLARVDHGPTVMLTKDGHLWWGIADVLTIMDEPKEDSIISKTQIEEIEIMGKPRNFVNRKWLQSKLKNIDTVWTVSMDSFYQVKNLPADSGYLHQNKITWDSLSINGLPVGLKLPYHQNHITFRFSGTQLANLDKTRYSFILEGNETEWSSISNKSFVDYRNLSPGKYTFKVHSRGFNGIWSHPAVMQFTILPPWWNSGWAYTFYALIFLGALRTFSFWRERRLRKEKEQLQNKVEERTVELRKSLIDLKSTQAQLIQSEKMASLGALTAGIAHEIQNPLNFVNNFAEVSTELIDEVEEERQKRPKQRDEELVTDIMADLKENLKKITHHGKRAGEIVKGMLQHSRTSSGQKELTDLNVLADEYLRLAYHGLRAKDKSFNSKTETDFDPALPKIEVVPQDIGRVILNLITNAFYAVNERAKQGIAGYEPMVSVSTKKKENAIEISVKDNGNGIPEQIKEKIFQPFFTTKPTGSGTGLGLSLSYNIVKAHGGELNVETKEGEGTAFIIKLPVA